MTPQSVLDLVKFVDLYRNTFFHSTLTSDDSEWNIKCHWLINAPNPT